MPPKKISLKTTQLHQNKRLDHVLAEFLPQALKQDVSKGKVRKLIVAGAVYLNGRRVRIASKELMPNAVVDIYVDIQKLNSDQTSRDSKFVMAEKDILFEDPYLIAVNKPPGLPTQPTLDEARDNLYLLVKKFLAKRSGKSISDVYLGLHHRLDRDTSGVILFTKSKEINPGIASIFSNHTANKTYQALTSFSFTKSIPETWTVKNYLGRSKDPGSSSKKTRFCSVRSGGDFAHTDFKLIQKMNQALWIEALLHTGRTHQIRVHLSEAGMPILGDLTYGTCSQIGKIKIPRLMLHAACLTFEHPLIQNKISIQCPIPEDFSQCLKELQKGDFRDS